MENPPSYDEICKTVRDGRAQQVTLTLVLPTEPEDQTQQHDQSKDNDGNTVEPPPYQLPSEPPPKYSQETDLESKLADSGLLLTNEAANTNSKLGADMIFTLAFIIAFLFNWIGFIFAYCLSLSMAGRFGALSGFGASMVKWSIIAMNSQCCSEYLKSASCLLVALIFCGFLIFVRGIYLHIKHKGQKHNGQDPDKPLYVVYHQM